MSVLFPVWYRLSVLLLDAKNTDKTVSLFEWDYYKIFFLASGLSHINHLQFQIPSLWLRWQLIIIFILEIKTTNTFLKTF